MAHLGRVTYCLETLLLLCKLVFFNYNFHKNTDKIKTKEVFIKTRSTSASHSIEGQVTNWTTEKWSILEATLLGPLLPPRNSSYCYFDTVCKICFSFANLGNTPLASSLFILLLYLIQIQNKENKKTVENSLTVVSVVQWLSRPPHTRKVASSNLAGNILLFSLLETNKQRKYLTVRVWVLTKKSYFVI